MKVKSLIPVALPKTPDALEAFVQTILVAGDFPDNSSFRVAIYSQILHTTVGSARLHPRVFINAVRRSICNQLSYGLMMDCKAIEKQEVDNANKAVQETTSPMV
jgi:hypothetical protein